MSRRKTDKKMKVYIVLAYIGSSHARVGGVYATECGAISRALRLQREWKGHVADYSCHVIKKSVNGSAITGSIRGPEPVYMASTSIHLLTVFKEP